MDSTEAREYGPAPDDEPGRKIEARKATETTLKNYYEDTRYLIGRNIQPAQSYYHASGQPETKGMQRRIESEGWGASPRRLRQFMDRLKKKTPKEWIAERKWREFLGSIPLDGKPHIYTVPHPNDLMTIRVTATQVKTEDRWYKVEVDLARCKARIIVNPTRDD